MIEVGNATILQGDCLEMLKKLPDESVQCCVTSPPYWGLRDYGHDGQIGMEATPEDYTAAMVAVFREVRRVLKADGTLWLNLGDSYVGSGFGSGGTGCASGKQNTNKGAHFKLGKIFVRTTAPGLKAKDLVGIPWMVAFALRTDGWYLRSEIIWAKPNPMPESVIDRPTKAHEQIFLLTKSAQYYYDSDAIKEPSESRSSGNVERKFGEAVGLPEEGLGRSIPWEGNTRNKRTVWTIATQANKEAHFATFPPKLIEPCVLAGSKQNDTILDCFNGSGTTGIVALKHDRRYVGIELNPEYVALTIPRLESEQQQMKLEI
jgi:DNA modification methylase